MRQPAASLPNEHDRFECEFGERIHQEILKRFRVYDDPAVTTYVREIMLRLTPFCERRTLPYAITILYDDRIYSTVAPGGRVYLTTGFIRLCQNEAELASVIAHELAQAQYRVPNPRVKERYKRVRPFLVFALSSVFGAYGQVAAMGVDAFAAFSLMEKSRARRAADADRRALSYLVQAGYDPQGMIDVFYLLLDFGEKDIVKLYNYNISHPISNERFNALMDSYKALDLTGKTLVTDHERFMEKTRPVRELPIGE